MIDRELYAFCNEIDDIIQEHQFQGDDRFVLACKEYLQKRYPRQEAGVTPPPIVTWDPCEGEIK